MQVRNAAALLPLVVMLAPAPAEAQRWEDLEDALEGRELIMRPTVEGRRKVYIELGDLEAFALHRGDRLFPLRESEPVRIVAADPEDRHIELEIASSRLGRGRVDFHGSPPAAEDFERWLDAVFEVLTPEADFHQYIGNSASRALHIRGANHLPPLADREPFSSADDALGAGYHRCGVCFVPTPDVSDYDTERSLAMLGLQQVRSTYYPHTGGEFQADVERIGRQVLDGWPVPLKGYRYRFQVVDTDDINAMAVPTGYIFVTRGLLEALETDEELAAILAHEIAHVESRHSYRMWRNAQKTSFWTSLAVGIAAGAAAAAGAMDPGEAAAVAASMGSFTAELFMLGHGRDREREADLFASFYLNDRDIGDGPLLNAFRKLKFARDAVDPFGRGGGGLFATHPHIEERLDKATGTQTAPFPADAVFQGLRNNGALVATLRFDVQRLFRNELDVVATLSTTAELGEEDNVNTLDLRIDGERIELREETAEKIFPSDEVSAVFGTNRANGLIEGPFSVSLKLRNVDRWERAAPPTEAAAETPVR